MACLKSKHLSFKSPLLLLPDLAPDNKLLHLSNPSSNVSADPIKHLEPVFINVYDLLSEYRAVRCFFKYFSCHCLGAYHTSVQIYNVEYYFGDGICKARPRSHPGRLILSKQVGMTELTQDEIETKILLKMYDRFTRKDYDLIRHNCNHFTDAFLYRLLGIHLPTRFNRTERCITAMPCCIRTLNGILGNEWTRPVMAAKSQSTFEYKNCCHRVTKKNKVIY